MKMYKKGIGVEDLMPLALMLVVAVIAISIGADVVDSVQEDQTPNSYAYNISASGLEGIDELGSWMPTLALVLAASIVIGVLVYSFVIRS